MEKQIKTLLLLAVRDEDEWVQTIGQLLEDFPDNQTIKLELSNNQFNLIMNRSDITY